MRPELALGATSAHPRPRARNPATSVSATLYGRGNPPQPPVPAPMQACDSDRPDLPIGRCQRDLTRARASLTRCRRRDGLRLRSATIARLVRRIKVVKEICSTRLTK